MTQGRLEPLFLESSAGRIFLILRVPEAAQHCVLFVPPFGEEMNKSRRQVTETAQSLVAKGFAVIVFDLLGTGDSQGDFADATWEAWKTNVASAMEWAEREGLPVDMVIATRLGCALAAESLQTAGRTVSRTIFWQPVDNGRQFMTQLLRLRVAASLMEADKNETVDGLKTRLASGETLEIAGYALSSDLWRSIEAIELATSLHLSLGKLQIVEIGRSSAGAMSPAGRRLIVAATERGVPVSGERIAGEPFWTATEIVTNTELKDITVACLAEGVVP